jgi:hypothetical protein
MACDVRSGNASEVGENADRDVAKTIEEGLGGHEILSFVALNLMRGF